MAIEEGNVQVEINTGWALKKGDYYWGLTTLAMSPNGKNVYGWTEDNSNICIAKGIKKPPVKSWFVSPSEVDYATQMEQGEWVRVTLKVEATLTTHGD